LSEFKKIEIDNKLSVGTKSFIITSTGLSALKNQLISIPETNLEIPVGVSLLNTPVMDNIVFQEDSYTDLEGNEIYYDELRIDAVLIEVIQTKNIVKTSIQGRPTTVKEFISDGDYKINIRGVINNKNRIKQKTYPLTLMQNFVNICKAQSSILVTSTFLNEVFEINDIVIESYNVPQIEGQRNQQVFSISASSDVPVKLEELEL